MRPPRSDSQTLPAPTADRIIATLAARQHGVVSIAQLRAAGLGAGAIKYRVSLGRLHPIHRGVYAVGHARLIWPGRLWAAVLAHGGSEAAVLSYRTAATLWGLANSALIEVTTLRRHHSTPGIRVHRGRSLEPSEIATDPDYGLPLTSPMRTLIDEATVVMPRELKRLCHRAEHLRLLDARLIPDGRRGARPLRAAIATLERAEPQITRNDLEEAMLAIVDRLGLPQPCVNFPFLDYVIDFYWPDHGLAVETDGRDTHLTPTAFEDDRRRDARLSAAGLHPVRFTYRQVMYESEYVGRTLCELLARYAPRSSSALSSSSVVPIT